MTLGAAHCSTILQELWKQTPPCIHCIRMIFDAVLCGIKWCSALWYQMLCSKKDAAVQMKIGTSQRGVSQNSTCNMSTICLQTHQNKHWEVLKIIYKLEYSILLHLWILLLSLQDDQFSGLPSLGPWASLTWESCNCGTAVLDVAWSNCLAGKGVFEDDAANLLPLLVVIFGLSLYSIICFTV